MKNRKNKIWKKKQCLVRSDRITKCTGIPEGERERGRKKILEDIIPAHFLNSMKDRNA